MLKRIWRFLWPSDAPQTLPRHEGEPLTEERLSELLDDHMKEITFEWNEWYEKFDKLHLRLAKRADREAKKRNGSAAEVPHSAVPGVTVLHHRKLGSV